MTSLQRISQGIKLFCARISILFRTHPFESLFGLPLALFYGWYLLALSGLFYPSLILLVFLVTGIGIVLLLSKKPAFCTIPSALLIVFLLFFAILALTSHPIEIVSEGRDQGTFVTSALLLNASHSFLFVIPEAQPFFQLYGEGKALNFPGLAYTAEGNLTPEFPLGYIVWLGGFVALFGLTGFALANTALYLFSGMLLYTLLKRVLSRQWAFFATLIGMGGFLPLWFLSFTLSENLALVLFLLTTEAALRFYITKDRVTLLLAGMSAFALALTRIEGWAVLGLLFCILTFKKTKADWIQRNILQKPYWGIIWLLAAGIISVWTFCLNTPYYKAIAKALLKTADQGTSVAVMTKEAFPLYKVLWEYGLIILFFSGLLACLYFWKKKRIHLLFPFFLALPTLPYLLIPHITPDAPWMLRRFFFSLYPVFFISTLWAVSILLTRYNSKRSTLIWILVLGTIMALQVPAMRHFTQTSYPKPLLLQVENIASQLSSQDLLLVDKGVTGDNFMMIPRILSVVLDRPAVYFFNPDDLATIDTTDYARVLLLTPTDKVSFYESALKTPLTTQSEFTFINDHSFRTIHLKNNTLPSKNLLITPVSLLVLPQKYAR